MRIKRNTSSAMINLRFTCRRPLDSWTCRHPDSGGPPNSHTLFSPLPGVTARHDLLEPLLLLQLLGICPGSLGCCTTSAGKHRAPSLNSPGVTVGALLPLCVRAYVFVRIATMHCAPHVHAYVCASICARLSFFSLLPLFTKQARVCVRILSNRVLFSFPSLSAYKFMVI